MATVLPVTRTVFLGVRRVDPDNGLNDMVDLVVDGETVIHVGPVGSGSAWVGSTASTRIIDEPGLTVCPGLVDLHTHVFGAAGLPDPDVIGVRSAVPTIVDAGGAGAATIDDFAATVIDPAATRILSFLSIESGGIVEAHPAHNTRRRTTEMHTPSLADFLPAIERHANHVVGLKVWASGAAGLAWVDHAVSLAEMTSLRLLVHIGDVDAQDQPVALHSPADAASGDVLDRLQSGDIVTHCYTGLPGALIDAAGRISAEVRAARHRGVLFDPAPGSFNLRLSRAAAGLRQGWMPDVISSDLHRWSWDAPHRSVLTVMNLFMALGMSPEDVIARASTRPADALQIGTGRPTIGANATLSLLRLVQGESFHSDGAGSTLRGRQHFEPVGCLVDGTWYDASTNATPQSPSRRELTDDDRRFLECLRTEIAHHGSHDNRWRGEDLHRLAHRARAHAGLGLRTGIEATQLALGADDAPIAIGWLLESLGPERTLRRLSALTQPLRARV